MANGSRARLQAILRSLGLRVTPQRLIILEAIHLSPGHVTAEEIHRRIVGPYPSLNIATVYRNLDTLVATGLITETRLGAKSLYFELSPDTRHHHLVCERCGGTVELADSLVEPLRNAISATHGFDASIEHLAVFGICQVCQSPGREAVRKG